MWKCSAARGLGYVFRNLALHRLTRANFEAYLILSSAATFLFIGSLGDLLAYWHTPLPPSACERQLHTLCFATVLQCCQYSCIPEHLGLISYSFLNLFVKHLSPAAACLLVGIKSQPQQTLQVSALSWQRAPGLH